MLQPSKNLQKHHPQRSSPMLPWRRNLPIRSYRKHGDIPIRWVSNWVATESKPVSQAWQISTRGESQGGYLYLSFSSSLYIWNQPPQLPIYQVFEPLVPNILGNWKVRVYYSLAVWICQGDSLSFSTIWDWFITILRWEYVWVMFVENHFNLIKSVNNMFQDHRKSRVTVICPELTTSWL